MPTPAIAVHGGSGSMPKDLRNPDVEKRYHQALQSALDAGFAELKNKAPAYEAVIHAICTLEDCDLFNAGKGAVYDAKGEHRMDAAIMEGSECKAGAVAGIQGLKNPVLAAKAVMDETQYVFLAGKDATQFARQQGLEVKPAAYFDTEHRYKQWQDVQGSDDVKLDHARRNDEKYGTVGAVAVDDRGNLAAATSTGGLTNKAWGRVGDSPVIGGGTYAKNKTCAVSCTGYGEFFIRGVAAYDVSCLIEYKRLALEDAADEVINKRIKGLGGTGGLIAIDARGNIAMPFTSECMFRGVKNNRRSFTRIQ